MTTQPILDNKKTLQSTQDNNKQLQNNKNRMLDLLEEKKKITRSHFSRHKTTTNNSKITRIEC